MKEFQNRVRDCIGDHFWDNGESAETQTHYLCLFFKQISKQKQKKTLFRRNSEIQIPDEQISTDSEIIGKQVRLSLIAS